MPKMRSVMKHRFSEVPSVEKPRSTFDRSHGFKTTFDGGYLVPCLCDEIYPGDTVRCNMAGFARLSTPTFPVMDNMYLDTFFFFVPNRIIWANWKRFCGERDPNPDSSISYTVPQTVVNNALNQSLADYFGIPTQVIANNSVNALPFRAYRKIWNDWFRDENLQNSQSVQTSDDGPDTISVEAIADVLKRGKRHDYFTSCLPWLQRGDAVQLSLGSEAPIFGANMDFDDVDDSSNKAQIRHLSGATGALRALATDGSPAATVYGRSTGSGTGEMTVDLSQATASTVNELRLAIQTQRLLERDARSGTRYIEIVESHFGVKSQDFRMQRPEYLGGGSTPINITPIARTDTAPGSLGAFGTTGFRNHGFVKSFTEHGYIIGIMNVRADLTYQEGLDRMWSRSSRFDFYYPALAHLGEQSVLNKEIYVDATDLGDGTSEQVFGYQERWAELRYKKSQITGKFRSNDAATLEAWHLALEFGDTPTLDNTFIPDDPPIDRVIVTASEPHFIMDSYFNYIHSRCMPTYSVPGYIDHF